MTDHYAVFGFPITQSKSPQIHAMFAAQTGEDIHYDREEVQPGNFEGAVRRFIAAGGRGLNVTLPFKEEAFQLADTLSERARRAQAVNTLIVEDDGKLTGENTDGVGLVSDIRDRLEWSLKGARVLVLGAGGAVRGVLAPLLEAEPESLVLWNRTESKALSLAEHFADLGPIRAASKDDLRSPFSIVINGTAASLDGDVPAIDAQVIGPETSALDMMYSNEPTAFLQWAEKLGARSVVDGKGMLVGQAAEAFFLWRGVRPQVLPVLARL